MSIKLLQMLQLFVDTDIDKLLRGIIKHSESEAKASSFRPRNGIHGHDLAPTAELVVLPLSSEQDSVSVAISVGRFSLL